LRRLRLTQNVISWF